MTPVLADVGAVTVGAADVNGTTVVPVLKVKPTNTGVVMAFFTEIPVMLTANTGVIACRPKKYMVAKAIASFRQR